jgi:uncharacterized SAM-binding protein YcdF (DUF218 family)
MNKPSGRPFILHTIIAAACFLISAFLRFALIGYDFLAYVLAALGCLAVIFALLKKAKARHRKAAVRARNALCILLLAAAVAFAAAEIPVISAARTDDEPGAPYLIVLGAGLNGTAPSLSLNNRLEAALQYLQAYPEAKAIVTGGQGPGEDITEAEAMRIWLESKGIGPERIIKEEQAASTYENILFSLDLIEEDGGDPEGRVAIATSEYHLYRAEKIAEGLGAQPAGVAGKTTLPVLKINYFVREAFAVLYMWVF